MVAYDRRGFGESDPGDGYDYDTLADDLDNVLSDLDLDRRDAGRASRWAAARWPATSPSTARTGCTASCSPPRCPPYLLQSDDNPDGPLTEEAATGCAAGSRTTGTRSSTTSPRSSSRAGDDLKVTEEQRQEALALCKQSDQEAALGCMEAFGTTDFREDLKAVDRARPW